MSNDYEKLKTLLFKDELADLSAFRQLLNDDDALAEKLSQVLDQASDLALKNNPKFQKKFTSNQPEPYLKALKRDPKGLVALLTPIISPIIRSAVIQTMRNFISEINSTLEQGFSLKYLKWRWRARRTGIPLSEIVFEHTIQYQVQQLFLIDRETGLLVEYAGQEDELIQDKDAMSAMLTAIQDFVSDSLTADTGTLSAAELGDNLLWVFPGTSYNLAAIIKGAPSGRLRQQLADLLSHIHVTYEHDFEDQNLWNNHLAARHDLSEHLIQKKIEGEKKVTFWPWLTILALLVAWFSYNKYNDQKRLSSKLMELQKVPGLVVDQVKPNDDQFIVTGLQDPLADISGFNDVAFETQPFYSLDEQLTAKRVKLFLNDPSINFDLQNGELTINDNGNLKNTDHLTWLPGINRVKIKTIKIPADLQSQLNSFMSLNPIPNGLELSVKDKQIFATGMLKKSDWDYYHNILKEVFTDINSKNLSFVPSRERLVNAINNTKVIIHNLNSLSEENKKQISQILVLDKQITQFYSPGKLTIHAHSDCQGSIKESIDNNHRRLSMVQEFLLQSGLKSQQIESVIEKCETLSEQINPQKIGVWFEKQ